MPEHQAASQKGHIMATLRVDKILLKYFEITFNLRSDIVELRRRVASATGLADVDRLARLREEADRLEGLLKKENLKHG